MKAARADHLCTVQFLISKGADVNRQTSTNDHTVLSLACAGGHLAVVELLLTQGADPAHQDQDQDSLLVKRRNDNNSPGPVIGELVPSSHQRSELSNTILCIFSG